MKRETRKVSANGLNQFHFNTDVGSSLFLSAFNYLSRLLHNFYHRIYLAVNMFVEISRICKKINEVHVYLQTYTSFKKHNSLN